MLRHRLIHPQILEALAAAGHGAKILITDGNYPASTKLGANALQVYLNLEPGRLTVTEVLDVLLTAIPVEAAAVMTPESGPEPAVFSEFRARLHAVDWMELGRYEFYEEASDPDVCLQIITGDQRLYANILLTVGVVAPRSAHP